MAPSINYLFSKNQKAYIDQYLNKPKNPYQKKVIQDVIREKKKLIDAKKQLTPTQPQPETQQIETPRKENQSPAQSRPPLAPRDDALLVPSQYRVSQSRRSYLDTSLSSITVDKEKEQTQPIPRNLGQ